MKSDLLLEVAEKEQALDSLQEQLDRLNQQMEQLRQEKDTEIQQTHEQFQVLHFGNNLNVINVGIRFHRQYKSANSHRLHCK